jgi:hypothetical protein
MLNALERPSKEVLMAVQGISYLFALGAVGAIVAWIYYVAKAVEADHIGGSDGFNGRKNDTVVSSESRGPVSTATTMFEGVVLGVLVYMVFRHHYRNHY